MLGKTNITAIQESTNVTDIEDYIWKSMKIDGVNSDFVKAVYGNDMLVAITRDGTIVSTADGENWKKTRIETEDAYELEDIIWTGSQYVMVGNRKEIVTESAIGEGDSENVYRYHGIIVTSEQLVEFSIEEDTDNSYSRYYAVIEKEEKRIIISKEYKNDLVNAGVYAIAKDFNGILKKKIYTCSVSSERICGNLNDYKIIVAKKHSGGAVYVEDNHSDNATQKDYNGIYVTLDWMKYSYICVDTTSKNTVALSMFECKDTLLFYANPMSYDGIHQIYQILDGEKYPFNGGHRLWLLDAVYFNKCEVFVNAHSMIVVRPEDNNIGYKTPEDLIDITYDFEIRFIEKAFAGLYIFGTDGNILASSDEAKNEELTAVKTMSAVRALYDAKAYADEKYAALEARIMKLENRVDLTAD